jgi:hypothetical protein
MLSLLLLNRLAFPSSGHGKIISYGYISMTLQCHRKCQLAKIFARGADNLVYHFT